MSELKSLYYLSGPFPRPAPSLTTPSPRSDIKHLWTQKSRCHPSSLLSCSIGGHLRVDSRPGTKQPSILCTPSMGRLAKSLNTTFSSGPRLLQVTVHPWKAALYVPFSPSSLLMPWHNAITGYLKMFSGLSGVLIAILLTSHLSSTLQL